MVLRIFKAAGVGFLFVGLSIALMLISDQFSMVTPPSAIGLLEFLAKITTGALGIGAFILSIVAPFFVFSEE